MQYLRRKRSKASSPPTGSLIGPPAAGPAGRFPRSDASGPHAPETADQGGGAIYSRRKTVVEPVFGQIKQARGFRQFLLRGLEKVQGEWAMICLTHNILKLHRLCYG